jgi:hypothetical protein
MTTPADKNLPDRKQLAKDVASELAARQRRKKLLVLALVAALIIAAIMYLQFGKGWGLGGGKGKDKGTGPGSAQGIAAMIDAGPARCSVRVSAEGITVDGAKATRDEVVAHCKKTDGAMVVVTGDARQGDWDELRAALQAVGVKIYIRGQLWDGQDAESTGSGSGSAP